MRGAGCGGHPRVDLASALTLRNRFQKGNQVGTVGRLVGQANNHHVARYECTRIGQPAVEGLFIPDDARLSQGIRILEAWLGRCPAPEHAAMAWAWPCLASAAAIAVAVIRADANTIAAISKGMGISVARGMAEAAGLIAALVQRRS